MGKEGFRENLRKGERREERTGRENQRQKIEKEDD